MDIPSNQRRMGRKDLDFRVGKLHSTHLAVLGTVDHLLHIPRALNKGKVDRA